MDKVSGIYSIRNTINGKIYVGSAVNLYKRRLNHLSTLRRNTHKNPHLQASFNKHGEDSFEFITLEKCNSDSLVSKE